MADQSVIGLGDLQNGGGWACIRALRTDWRVGQNIVFVSHVADWETVGTSESTGGSYGCKRYSDRHAGITLRAEVCLYGTGVL